jgi:hypothetical protein
VPVGGGPYPIDVLGNDTGSGLHVTAFAQGTHGDVALLPFGAGVTYQPTPGFAGTDQFTYTITGTSGQTATATVTVNTVARYAPTAQVTGPISGQAGQSVTFTVSGSDVSAYPAPGFGYKEGSAYLLIGQQVGLR